MEQLLQDYQLSKYKIIMILKEKYNMNLKYMFAYSKGDLVQLLKEAREKEAEELEKGS